MDRGTINCIKTNFNTIQILLFEHNKGCSLHLNWFAQPHSNEYVCVVRYIIIICITLIYFISSFIKEGKRHNDECPTESQKSKTSQSFLTAKKLVHSYEAVNIRLINYNRTASQLKHDHIERFWKNVFLFFNGLPHAFLKCSFIERASHCILIALLLLFPKHCFW